MNTLNQNSTIDVSEGRSTISTGIGATDVDWNFWLAGATEVEVAQVQESDEETEDVLPEWIFEIPPVNELIEFLDSHHENLDVESDAGTYATPAPSTPASFWAPLDDDELASIDSRATDELSRTDSEPPDPGPESQGVPTVELNIAIAAPSLPVGIIEHRSTPPASSSTGRRGRILLAPRDDDGSDSSIPKDADGYVVPLAIYTRLADEGSTVKTEVLDRVLAPTTDASLRDFDAGTITCQIRRRIVNGLWVTGSNSPCGTTLRSWDSYRRHLLRSHLDLPRTNSISEEARKRRDELPASISHTVESPAPPDPSYNTRNQRRNCERKAGRLGIKRRREMEAEVDEFVETGRVAPTKHRKIGKE